MSDLTLNRYLMSGTLAEREAHTPDPSAPASGPDHGALWYETDTGQLYAWDGAAWVAVAGSGEAGPPIVAQTSYIVSGLQVTWDSGLTFRVSSGVYYIEGVRYEFEEDTITLDAADATNPRIDVLVVNTSAALAKVTGTAAASPSEPSTDPGTQLKLIIVTVPATATQPAAASSQTVYLENAGHAAEWDATASGASIVVNSTNNPRTGTIDIEATNLVAGVYAQLAKGGGGTADPTAFNHLRLFVRSKATWANNRGFQVILLSTGVQKGVAVAIRRSGTYGFDSSITATYQQVAIPMSDFQVPGGVTINQIRLQGFGGAVGFYVDDITLQVSGGSGPGSLGDVIGPASAVDDRIATFDGTTGKRIQDGGTTIAGLLATANTAAEVDAAAALAAAAAYTDSELAAHVADEEAHAQPATIGATFAGDDLAVGVTLFVRVPHGLTPTTWVIFADDMVSIVIDIWADTLANYPPADADTITGGNEPEVSGAVIDDGDASGFDPIVAGDFVGFTIDSLTVGSATKVTIQLFGTRT